MGHHHIINLNSHQNSRSANKLLCATRLSHLGGCHNPFQVVSFAPPALRSAKAPRITSLFVAGTTTVRVQYFSNALRTAWTWRWTWAWPRPRSGSRWTRRRSRWLP